MEQHLCADNERVIPTQERYAKLTVTSVRAPGNSTCPTPRSPSENCTDADRNTRPKRGTESSVPDSRSPVFTAEASGLCGQAFQSIACRVPLHDPLQESTIAVTRDDSDNDAAGINVAFQTLGVEP